MSAVWLDKEAWESMPEPDMELMRMAMANVSLGEVAVYDDGSGKLWDVFSSLEMTLDDMTFLGSTAFVLRGNSYPYDQMARCAEAGATIYGQSFLWGVLVGMPQAPMIWHEDINFKPNDDRFEVTMDDNSKNNKTIGAGVIVPGDWTPWPPPVEEES